MKLLLLVTLLLAFCAPSTPALAQTPDDFSNGDFEACTVAGVTPPGWDTLDYNGQCVANDEWAGAAFMDYVGGEWRSRALCQDFVGTGVFGVTFYCGAPAAYLGSILVSAQDINYVGKSYSVTCPVNSWAQRTLSFVYTMTNPRICLSTTSAEPIHFDDVQLLFALPSTPTPTPTPDPLPTPPPPMSGTVETTTEIQTVALGLCDRGMVKCESFPTLDLYVNGLYQGPCEGDEYPFYPRGIHSDTVSLVNTTAISASFEVSTRCDYFTSLGTTFEVPVPTVMHPVTASMSSPGSFLGIDFRYQGGQLPWLERAKQFITIINSGNLLFIISGIFMAGMVLSWAIQQVKHPKSW